MTLSAAQVVQLRLAYAQGATQAGLARRYGITQQTVSRVVRGQTHKRDGGPIQQTRRPAVGKIKDLDRLAIMVHVRAGALSYAEIGRLYGVSGSYIGMIARGKRRRGR